MKTRSLGKNALLNTLKQCCTVLFPLITFPYVSRVLEVNAYGRFNFANSFVSYIILLAALGINTYSIREASRIRTNRDELQKFANQIFSINVLTTAIAYLIMFILLAFWVKLHDSFMLIVVLGIAPILNTIGQDWVNNVFEDFGYITIRYILFQVISICMMFLFVKNPDDYIKYAAIYVFANSGPCLFNLFYVRKYVHIKFSLNLDLKKHIKPMLLLFCNTLAVTIYVNSDILLLGVIKSEYEVGIYSISVKIYSIVKQLLNAICVVVIPRIGVYLGNNDREKYNDLLNNTLAALIGLLLPVITGLFFLSNDVVYIVAGADYSAGSNSLRILCFSLFFAVMSCFFSNVILIPNKKEKIVLKATIISAFLNLILNLVAIPLWGSNGAALTTVVAETIVMIISMYHSRTLWLMSVSRKNIMSFMVGCMCISGCLLSINCFIHGSVTRMLISVPLCGLCYFIILMITQNEYIYKVIHTIKKRG